MAYLLVLVPLGLAALTFALPWERWRPWFVPGGALLYLILALTAVLQPADAPAVSALGGWLLLDPLGKVFLGFLSVLFFLCSLYVPGYLAFRSEWPNRIFCANLFVALAMMA